MKDIVRRLFARMGKSKATSICPYVFHMYHTHRVLLPDEKKVYRTAEALLKYNVDPEEEEAPKNPEASEDSDCESLNSKEIQEIQRQEFVWMKKPLCNKRGSPVAKDLVEHRKTSTLLEGAEWNYQSIANNLKEIRDRSTLKESLSELCARSSETSSRRS